ncbi:MAG: serine hydrolase domain-containing protein [Gemmatimonadota bacterium]|jgi:CubicO group peptidase (beta-lactamase class C family)
MKTHEIVLLGILLGCGPVQESALTTPKGRAALDEVLASSVGAGGLPGVVAAITTPDSVVYRGAFGTMDASGRQPMAPDALFQIFSMTKPITSAAIMTLVEEGAVDLDAPAEEYLPELRGREVLVAVDTVAETFTTRPASRPITVRDLLRHTSGIGYSFASHELVDLGAVTDLPARAQPILHDPGAGWTYGMGTAFLGWIVEEVSGESLDDFLESRVLAPLGMDHTFFTPPQYDSASLVATYRREGGQLIGSPRPQNFPGTVRGDGGLLSTAGDYARFMQMILNGGERGGVRVLSEESVAEMTRDQLDSLVVVEQPGAVPAWSRPFPLGAGRDGFGLGFQIKKGREEGKRPPGSLSWAGIQNTHFWIDVENGIGIVLLLQVLPFYDEAAIHLLTEFERVLYSDVMG